MARSTLRHAAVILTALLSMTAHAQTSGSVTLVSDYRFRGMSLSDGRPAPQLSLEYNSTRDWYVGVFASQVAARDDRDRVQLIAYGGYAHRLTDSASWEAGLLRSSVPGTVDYRYAEIYLGLSSDNISGRMYFSPNYYGPGTRTLYTELNGAYPVLPWLQLIGHAGLLANLSNDVADAVGMSSRWDVRAGVGVRLDDWNVQLAVVTMQREASQPAPSVVAANGYGGGSSAGTAVRVNDPHAVVLSVSHSF
jgi:uncharacterized protein (TIGR02001 family)